MNIFCKSVAIFPARGGSERIKNKNIRKFNTKPILEWTYEIIKKSNLFDLIVLSSDSKKIINIGKKIGFDEIITRPKKLADNFTETKDVIIHSIKYLSKFYNFKNVFCVYPCSPFIYKKDLLKAFQILKSKKNSFIFPIVKYSHPIERAHIYRKKN